ncbi:phosphate ABC transporter substrate-binding protein PstS [Candidatus Nitrosotenuis chungbukensis]|uniref:phosphate ABC transporter substrate-binding protein PstS n=2 Tax=Candidatus Nitrosotenuis chungbukensis TaxID=1353246 RepID=UPI0026735DFD|nr:phosphate ABC transporter substrate-binding protein PstS [Candidatus Nitrosotenuis chungbukensis]WKT58265.1 phosphate ABC transporter substrate-binding protein PstS [Candidatus Nitrosotenuis chungbukensis]
MKKILSITLSLILMASVFVPLSASAASWPEPPKSDKTFAINGAGATFPYPLIDTWRVEYNKLHPNVNLNYQSIGSGGGVKQHTERTVNFGASDAPLTAAEANLASGTLHIPEAIGSVVMAYYLPEVPKSGLKLTGEIVADIYLGKIKRWNDPKIAELNPETKMPDRPILVTRRSDGSGTTYVFTDYLSKVSKEWAAKVGVGKSVPWPTGVGAAGNEGVAWATRNTKYAIGYVELAYAFQNGMTYAYLQNADKTKFIEPNLESVFAAVSAFDVDQLPKAEADWSKVSITNAPGANSYPIASFTYLLLYENIDRSVKSMDEAKALIHLVHWMITDGQKFSKPLLYDPLPPAVQELGKQGLARITFNGETVWNYGSAKQAGIEPIKSDTADKKTEPKKTEPKKTETKKTEPKKTETKKTETKKTETKKTETKKTETKKTETKKTETKKTEPKPKTTTKPTTVKPTSSN